MPRHGEIRLELSSKGFLQLQDAANGTRAGSTTVRVSVEQLQQLLRDHQALCAVAARRGVTLIEEA